VSHEGLDQSDIWWVQGIDQTENYNR